MNITERQRHVMEHATGWRSRSPGYRNHFVAEPGHHDWPTLQTLCEKGLMRVSREPSELSGGSHVFAVTTAGLEMLKELP